MHSKQSQLKTTKASPLRSWRQFQISIILTRLLERELIIMMKLSLPRMNSNQNHLPGVDKHLKAEESVTREQRRKDLQQLVSQSILEIILNKVHAIDHQLPLLLSRIKIKKICNLLSRGKDMEKFQNISKSSMYKKRFNRKSRQSQKSSKNVPQELDLCLRKKDQLCLKSLNQPRCSSRVN